MKGLYDFNKTVESSGLRIVKKVIWIFRLPMTKDENNIQRVHDDMMQTRTKMHNTGMHIVRKYPQIIISKGVHDI